MKKLQKVSAILLSLSLLLVPVLTGCTGKKTEETKKTQDTKPQKRGKITATIYDRGNVPAAEGTIENNRWT